MAGKSYDSYFFNYGEWHEYPIVRYGEEIMKHEVTVHCIEAMFDKASGKMIMMSSVDQDLKYVPEKYKRLAEEWGYDVLRHRYGWPIKEESPWKLT